ncbi:hypothetical protein VTK56DRAFT_755 [Thermocarpiscus australiensis]
MHGNAPNKAPIPDRLLDGHKPEDGHQHTLADSGKSQHSERAPQVDSSERGAPGQLAQDIIPPPGLVTPHLQPPLPPTYISSASVAASREDNGGDHESPALALDKPSSTMIFSDLYKSPRSPLSKLRNSLPHAVPPASDLEADLVSKDKVRQKEAVKRYLAEKVRNDWEFAWPPAVAPEKALPDQGGATEDKAPVRLEQTTAEDHGQRDPGEEADSESDAESVYSTVSEDPVHFRPRAEWTSDLSDEDERRTPASPFRFDSPEAVGSAVRTSIETRRTRRRRALRKDATWNPGLACFEARRNAWTGARTVRVKPKPPCPVSPSSARRFFWRHHRTESSASQNSGDASSSPPTPTSPLQPTASHTSQHTDTPISRQSSLPSSVNSTTGVQRTPSQESAPPVPYPIETLLPLPPPLLPPQNPMRASVTPSMYGSLYDKVVVQGLQPSCPVNLSDMVRACVVGWKRDGEWPPRSSYPAPDPAPAPAPAQTTAAGLLAARQRKAQQQHQMNAARKVPASSNNNNKKTAAADGGSTSRRLSLSFFGGGGGGNRGGGGADKAAAAAAAAQEERDRNKEAGGGGKKEGKENNNRYAPRRSNSQSHSDEAGSAGKTLFRRSLQKVLSLGQGQGHGHAATTHGASAPLSATAPSAKEGNAGGL